MKRYEIHTKNGIYYEDVLTNDIYDLDWHREDDAALFEYYADGSIRSKSWYHNNVKHRINEPAVITHYKDGCVSSESYFLNGMGYTKSDFDYEMFKIKLGLL